MSELIPMLDSAGSMVNNVMNTVTSAITSKKQAAINRKLYERQRADALSDWNRTNAYNSPAEQMKRLKEAGLNPNLVYGKGADNTAGAVRSSDYEQTELPPNKHEAPPASNSLMAMYDIESKKANTENLKAQLTILDQEAKLKEAQTLETYTRTANTAANTARTNFDLGLAQELRSNSLEVAKSNLAKLQADVTKTTADTNYTTDQNRRSEDLHKGNLEEQIQRIATARIQRSKTQWETAQIKRAILNMRREGIIKDMEIDQRMRGGNPNDTYYEKIIQDILEYVISGGKDVLKYYRMLMRENVDRIK